MALGFWIVNKMVLDGVENGMLWYSSLLITAKLISVYVCDEKLPESHYARNFNLP